VKGRFPGRLDHIKQRREAQAIVDEVMALAEESAADDDNNDDEPVTQETGASVGLEPSDTFKNNVSAKRRKCNEEEDTSTSPATSVEVDVVSSTSYSRRGSNAHTVVAAEELGLSDRVSIGFLPTTSGDAVDDSAWLVLSCPLGVASHKEGIHTCCTTGRVSVSKFRLVDYDAASDTSLVECVPVTGRTHQLRLHLEFLGCPIANDPCYGGQLFYGEPARKQAALDLLVLMRLQQQIPISKTPYSLSEEADGIIAGMSAEDRAKYLLAHHNIPTPSTVEASRDSATETVSEEEAIVIQNCRYCKDTNSPELERLLHCDGVWLHALRYEGQQWRFQAPMPLWSQPFDGSTLTTI
jgi:hypothetical protein